MDALQWTQTRKTGPSDRPLSVDELKSRLNLSQYSAAHDDKLIQQIDAATQQFEADTDRICLQQTFELFLDAFPDNGEIPIPKRPLSSVTSIKYYDEDATEQTLGTSIYKVDFGRRRIRLEYEQEWPNHITKPNSITIEYVAGTPTAASVPQLYKQAIAMLAGSWFDDPAMERLKNPYQNTYHAIVDRLLSTGELG